MYNITFKLPIHASTFILLLEGGFSLNVACVTVAPLEQPEPHTTIYILYPQLRSATNLSAPGEHLNHPTCGVVKFIYKEI